MVKRGAKPKNQNFNDEDRGSEVRTRSITPNHDEADEVFAKHQQFRSSVIRDGVSSTLMPTESYDSTHCPFFLHSADHSGFLDGSLIRPSIDDRYFKIWSRCNSMVKSWLLNVVNKEIYDSILYYEDAAEMWDDLFRRFKVNNLPRKYQLEQAVMTLKQGDSDLSTYFTKKKTLWEQLANTKSSLVKKCNCDQVKELLEDAETSRIIQFLMGLNDSFNKICGQILNMKPPPLLNDIYNMLDQDESQRLIGNNTKVSPAPVAFQMQSVTPDNGQIMLAQGGNQKPKCSHCHRIGHTVDKCYKVHGYPPGHPQRGKPTIGHTVDKCYKCSQLLVIRNLR
ncbi:uncharacterized protein LOC106372892 [Brassica napus]|uniref:uncharacterized protein LOC106372892 n=1 Tax=Brassica napus TaxID=3708 RepID=UPI0020788F50|nr:uncharacterized protein LOC106372892 [Brassica napus]